jgi:hypothetical protein
MKREGSTPASISNEVLATRYAALQQLRERVRRAEARFASNLLKNGSIFQPASKSSDRMHPRKLVTRRLLRIERRC